MEENKIFWKRVRNRGQPHTHRKPISSGHWQSSWRNLYSVIITLMTFSYVLFFNLKIDSIWQLFHIWLLQFEDFVVRERYDFIRQSIKCWNFGQDGEDTVVIRYTEWPNSSLEFWIGVPCFRCAPLLCWSSRRFNSIRVFIFGIGLKWLFLKKPHKIMKETVRISLFSLYEAVPTRKNYYLYWLCPHSWTGESFRILEFLNNWSPRMKKIPSISRLNTNPVCL